MIEENKTNKGCEPGEAFQKLALGNARERGVLDGTAPPLKYMSARVPALHRAQRSSSVASVLKSLLEGADVALVGARSNKQGQMNGWLEPPRHVNKSCTHRSPLQPRIRRG